MDSTETQQREKDLAAATAALALANEARDAVRKRIDQATRDLAAVDGKVLALGDRDADSVDMKLLVRLSDERQAVGVALEVLQRASLPRAEAALTEARAALAQAEKAVEAVRAEEALAAFHTSGARATEVAVAAIAELRPLLAEHAAAAEGAAAHGFNPGDQDALLRAHRLLVGRDFAAAFAELGRLVAAREAATAASSPVAVEERQRERQRERERADAHLAKLMRDRAESEAASGRRRATAGPGGLMPSGETFNDVKRL